jgi:hypothetical protein
MFMHQYGNIDIYLDSHIYAHKQTFIHINRNKCY